MQTIFTLSAAVEIGEMFRESLSRDFPGDLCRGMLTNGTREMQTVAGIISRREISAIFSTISHLPFRTSHMRHLKASAVFLNVQTEQSQ